MAHPDSPTATVDTRRYLVLNLTPPFVDVILRSAHITRREFAKIVGLTANYPNDPRLVEMVRQAGDASAKVAYLLAEGETPDSILAILRDLARPHLAYLRTLPGPLQATLELLLSLNTVPDGCEPFALPALLELDRIQGELVAALQERMNGRQLAQAFHADNHAALALLDQDWPRRRRERRVRDESSFLRPDSPLPEQPQMQYTPFFDAAGRLVSVSETCVILGAPAAATLQHLTPAVLRRPLPEYVPVPATGSADWLIREVGKIGRHFTRALLGIIQAHLSAERVALEAGNYRLIDQQAQAALREFVEDTP